MKVYLPAQSILSRSSWVSDAGWRWPRAYDPHGQGPGGLKAWGASWKPGQLHPCLERRAPVSALEQTPGWRGEWGCRLEAAWRLDPLALWDSTACGAPDKGKSKGVKVLLISSFKQNIKKKIQMQIHNTLHILHFDYYVLDKIKATSEMKKLWYSFLLLLLTVVSSLQHSKMQFTSSLTFTQHIFNVWTSKINLHDWKCVLRNKHKELHSVAASTIFLV